MFERIINDFLAPSYYSDGTVVPDLLTEEEAIRFLRLDNDGPAKPHCTLEYYRSKKLLLGTRVGKRIRYQRRELLQFLDRITQRTENDIS